MTRAKTVLDLFSNHELASLFIEGSGTCGAKDGTLIHQMALYELNEQMEVRATSNFWPTQQP